MTGPAAREGDMVSETIRFRYVHEDVSRHGQPRLYFRRPGGRKVRLPRPIGSPEFMALYHALLAGDMPPELPPSRTEKPAPQTWRWLCAQYMDGRAFRALNPSTQSVRRRILHATWAEPTAPGAATLFADVHLEHLTTAALIVLRDRKQLPEAANGRVKAIRAVYAWAHESMIVTSNPARDLAYITNRTAGFHTWSEPEIETYEARWPVGTKQRLALDLFLYAGVRRSDVVRLGKPFWRRPDQVRVEGVEAPFGWLQFRPLKTGPAGPMVTVPILEPLARSLAATKTGDLTYLVTAYGRPHTAKGFGGWFKAQCLAAGLPGCSAHGLRKAAATRCAENGASTHTLMAIFGWMTFAEAERYTQAVRRLRMSANGAKSMMREG